MRLVSKVTVIHEWHTGKDLAQSVHGLIKVPSRNSLEGLRKFMKYVITYNKSPDINSKRVLSEQYISSVLTLYQHSLYAPLSLSP